MSQAWGNTITGLTWALAAAVGLVLLGLAGLALFRPLMFKLGLRNLPRRRSQAALIVLGLTLSTIIVTSALATGDTLQYSVRRHAVDAYGEIDEVLAPPLLSNLLDLANAESSPNGLGNVDDLARLLGSEDVFSLLDTGLPGIPVARYEELRQQAAGEPLIDRLAPAIVFPTIIRNVSTGQGEPLGFIFAVDEQYDNQFGLHTVQGQPVTVAGLRPGAANIFQLTSDLFASVGKMAADSGLGPIKLSDVARVLAAAGTSIASQPSGGRPAATAAQAITGTAALSGTVAAPGTAQTPDELLRSLNLVTLRSELDRVLGEAGLELRQGDVYLSRMGAEKLDARPGDLLEIYVGPVAMPYRVKGIVDEAGPLAALMPVAVMRLDEAQRLLFMQGKVNTILVSNAGDREGGIGNTAAVASRLKLLALNDAAVQKAAAILRGPAGRQAIARALEAGLTGQQRETAQINQTLVAFTGAGANPAGPLESRLAALRRELNGPGDPAALRGLIADGEVRGWLQALELPEAEQAELRAALRATSEFAVIDLLNKATAVSVAEVSGGLFATLFSICGAFSILAGVLLIFLIFVMLAAERKSELGMARAVGLQRGHLIQMFVAEGLVYDLFAAALGLGLGLIISYVMIGYLGGLFRGISEQMGGLGGVFRFYFHVTRPSLIIAYCLGVLLTFVVVVIASWRVSRLNIVAAIRDLGAEADTRGERRWRHRAGHLVRGPLPLAAGVLLIVAARRDLTLLSIGATLALFGVAQILDWLLGHRTSVRAAVRTRLTYSLLGLGLLLIWAPPWERVLPAAPAGVVGIGSLATLGFILTVPMLILGAILLVVFNADALASGVAHVIARTGTMAPVLKTAVAYPLSARFRTGMAMLLFAMVITTVVVMAIVIQATETVVTPDDERTAGFDIISQPALLSLFNPTADLSATLRSQAGAPLPDIAGTGAVAIQSAEARSAATGQAADPAAEWRSVDLVGLDDGFLAQAGNVYTFARRAEGYGDDAAVWRALRERDDVAVASRDLADGALQATAGGPARWRLEGLDLGSAAPLPPLEVELRANAAAGPAPRRVQVIAVYDQAAALPGPGLHLNIRAVRDVMGKAEPSAFYVKARAGADVSRLAQALERTLVPYGHNVVPMAETLNQGRDVARGILQLLQGFMALGLLVGIAALGVISSRTVVERRQQIGMLRAIGYQPGMVALSFLLESGFIALSGIVIGTLVGVLVGREMVGGLLAAVLPGQTVPVPWGSIGGVLLLAYLFSLLTTLLPALQASRIYPAEALRYE